MLLDVVEDQSGKSYRMDHWAQRYPTNVGDIANFLVRFSGQYDLHIVLLTPFNLFMSDTAAIHFHRP